MNKPKYADRIIVGVRDDLGFAWHISDRDIWIMDIYKYEIAYKNIGFKINMDFILSLRNNMPILNEKTFCQYLKVNDDEIICADKLKAEMQRLEDNDTILTFRPSIYVDFVERHLYSMYPENIPYEKYVPDGWKGEFLNFTEQIPLEERYWNTDGNDLLKEIFEKEKQQFKGENNGK